MRMRTNEGPNLTSIIKIMQSIQLTQWNFFCYGTPAIKYCRKNICLWKFECLNNAVKHLDS